MDPAGDKRIERPTHFATNFRSEQSASFFVSPTRINSAIEGSRLRHQQAASILVHSSGELLVTCRWDERGYAEGDASNEQALYVSSDRGDSWTMAHGGEPIVTQDHGSSFTQPSSITHSFTFEDALGKTWLYYTINQPYTWGPASPHRSTGGGEIRRIRLTAKQGDWTTLGESEVVWAFMQALDDGRGDKFRDVRALCLNGILKLRGGRLLMPIAGRTTVTEPKGAFWPLDRCWVLESTDGGETWTASYFIGGEPSLCLCEPTIVESATDDVVVAYMRVQYDTGRELYRSTSSNGGRTWSSPRPAGLPNTGGSGTKPFITQLRNGSYALLQTNEHLVTDRTNISVFMTDEPGLANNHWPLVKVLSAECREHWLGSAYGWLAESVDNNRVPSLHAVWVSFTDNANHLNHARIELDWMKGTVVEPLAPNDASGNDLPRLETEEGRSGLHFPTVRSRAHAPHFGKLAGKPSRIVLNYRLDQALSGEEFPLLTLRSSHGRHHWLTVALRPRHSNTVWVHSNTGWSNSGMKSEGHFLELQLDIWPPVKASLAVNGLEAMPFFSITGRTPTTLYLGGNVASREPCQLTLVEASYGLTWSP
ncbi:MAG: sialidase family protein [Trueperaceae bacterium]